MSESSSYTHKANIAHEKWNANDLEGAEESCRELTQDFACPLIPRLQAMKLLVRLTDDAYEAEKLVRQMLELLDEEDEKFPPWEVTDDTTLLHHLREEAFDLLQCVMEAPRPVPPNSPANDVEMGGRKEEGSQEGSRAEMVEQEGQDDGSEEVLVAKIGEMHLQ